MMKTVKCVYSLNPTERDLRYTFETADDIAAGDIAWVIDRYTNEPKRVQVESVDVEYDEKAAKRFNGLRPLYKDKPVNLNKQLEGVNRL